VTELKREVERKATDRDFLQRQAYADSGKLNARASIYAYSDPRQDIWSWVVGLVDWPDGARALDVGCGPGNYLRHLAEHHPAVRAMGLDLSPGMAAEAAAHAPTVNGDAGRLPLRDDAVDRVLAPHMLYHCPDIPGTVAELRRVLGPGGAMVAVTNAQDHLSELWDAYTAVTGIEANFFVDRFDLDNGEPLLRTAFDHVEVQRAGADLLVPDAQPIVDYLASTFNFADREDDSVLEEIGRYVQQKIDREGVYRIHAATGAFVCR
jgi:SAM-dependent methyltransferase